MDDRVMPIAEVLERANMSRSTFQRRREAGLGPPVIQDVPGGKTGVLESEFNRWNAARHVQETRTTRGTRHHPPFGAGLSIDLGGYDEEAR